MQTTTALNVYRMLKISSVVISLFYLTGCGLKPVTVTPTQTYVLNPTIPTLTAHSTTLTLLVETPKASQAFDTPQIAYVNKPYQLAYFSYNQWADTPAQMLHPLLIQTLQNTDHFHAVLATAANGAQYDRVLNTRILQLQQSFLHHPSQVQFNIRAQLIDNNKHQVIATQQFNIIEPTSEDTPYDGVIAANKATEKLLQQIAEFCLANTAHQ